MPFSSLGGAVGNVPGFADGGALDAFGGAGNTQYTNPVVPYNNQYGGAAPDYKNTLYPPRPASDPRFSGWS